MDISDLQELQEIRSLHRKQKYLLRAQIETHYEFRNLIEA